MSTWVGGLAQWQEGDTLYLSVAFTYKLRAAYDLAIQGRASGLKVVAGGPALFLAKMHTQLGDVAEIGLSYPDAIARHNPDATFASRGCPVGCYFCIVPKMEGKEFTLIPDFPVRPILCDNNLSALPDAYQDYIIERYEKEDVVLRDANSGFEPLTFDPLVYERWRSLINAGGGPWRFAYDETRERAQVLDVMRILRDEPARRKRVYVLIGNEPFAECMERIREVIANGCEPHVQPYMKLTTLEREPHVGHDWTLQKLKDVARWANAFVWRSVKFEDYDRHRKNTKRETYDDQQGLFV